MVGMKILHIAAHLGGGAGKAISGIAIQGQQDYPDTHRILLLQQPEKDGYVRVCAEHQIPVSLWDGDASVLYWADVVVVSWWNHPVMAQFLRELPHLDAPLLLWSHVNGCHYPLLPATLALKFDNMLFTSPYSLDNPVWTEEERREIQRRSELVFGMGNFNGLDMIPKQDYRANKEFVVGYVGTLNYGKIHPDFALYCQEASKRIPNIRFVLVGDPDAKLEVDLQRAGLENKVEFTGFVSDVPRRLREFDVFGYLLNPTHYGTTENVLLEAMACGLPVVALRQNVEQHIVPEGGGYLVSSPAEYGKRMSMLAADEDMRKKMGQYARKYVSEYYHAQRNTGRFRNICAAAVSSGARASQRFSCMGDTPWDWFLFCLEEEQRELFELAWRNMQRKHSRTEIYELLKLCAPIQREERKSSLRHFATEYPDDESLQLLSIVMRQL